MTTFRRATDADFDALHALFVACGAALAEEGFDNWRDDPAERLRRDLATKEVYVAHDVSGLVATFALAAIDDGAYVGRVAVRPDAHGRGIGAVCMRAAEERARAIGVAMVRLDVLAANARLRAFYERLGYHHVGDVRRDRWTFASYQRRL